MSVTVTLFTLQLYTYSSFVEFRKIQLTSRDTSRRNQTVIMALANINETSTSSGVLALTITPSWQTTRLKPVPVSCWHFSPIAREAKPYPARFVSGLFGPARFALLIPVELKYLYLEGYIFQSSDTKIWFLVDFFYSLGSEFRVLPYE